MGGGMDPITDPTLGEVIAPELFQAMQTPEFQALAEDGWTVSSTPLQILTERLLSPLTQRTETVQTAGLLP